MSRNSLLVAAILVALVLGGVLWFVLTPDSPEELAQAGTRPVSETMGASTTQKPISGTETQGEEAQGGQPGEPGGNVGGSEATRTPEAEGTESGSEMASAAPAAETEAAADPEVAAAAPPPAEPGASAAAPPLAALAPSFDIVRVEKDGSAVIAGRAEPGTLVQLLDGEQVLAEAEAGADGSFAVVLDEPLGAGTRRLSLTAIGPDGMMVPSEDEVVVVVAGDAAPAASSEAVAAAEQSAEAAVAAVDAASEAAEPNAAADGAAPVEAATGQGTAAAPSESATAPAAAAAGTSTELAAEATPEAAPETTAEATAETTETTASDGAAATEPAASESAAAESAEVEVADTPALAEALEAEQDLASASTSSEPAPQVAGAEASVPLVVVQPKSGEGASQVLQGPAAAGEKPTVSIEAVDYDHDGQVVISGRAPAGAQVLLYLDHGVLGQATADGEGRWQLRPDGNVAVGLHRLRADLLDPAGAVLARAEIPFQRAGPIQVPPDEAFIVVQPGNSLWVIARKSYGQGIQYSAIYEANAGQIRNPHLIYPGQIFLVPTVN